MSVSIVAHRYAQALLELGAEQGRLEGLVSEFEAIAHAWVESAELRNVIENPMVAHEAKKAVLVDLATALGASEITKNALLLLVDRRRATALPYIAQTLRELADARKGILRAEVTTAVELSDGYYSALQSKLELLTGQSVVVQRRTDPALIGGVVARIGDRVYDGSLRTRLQSLKDALAPPI